MNPYGMKGERKKVWLDDHDNECYCSTELYRLYLCTNWLDESFDDWYKWKVKQEKRKTIQLRRTVLLHKILNNGYMVVNYVT